MIHFSDYDILTLAGGLGFPGFCGKSIDLSKCVYSDEYIHLLGARLAEACMWIFLASSRGECSVQNGGT